MTPTLFHTIENRGRRVIQAILRMVFILALVFVLSGAPQIVRADSLTVDTMIDENDGSCADDCSLRDAIAVANGGDTINFGISGTMVISSTLGQLSINKDLILVAPVAGNITIDGNNLTRVILVTTGATLELQGITISHGLVENVTGARGAGIYNDGTVVAIDSTFSDNHTNSFQSEGGAIYNNGGSLILSKSTFIDNSATSEWSYAGAIYNKSGVITITNTTFFSNTASSASYGQGGGIYNDSGAITITNSTFFSNTTSHSGSAIRTVGGSVTLRNTIIADSDPDGACVGAITNGGNNIDLGATCGWGSTNGSLSNTDPLLGALDYHGGRTQSFSLLAGSPAIDGVAYNPPNHCPAVDQRGLARPIDGDRDGNALCDIGAYEYPLYSWLPVLLR